MLCQWQLGGHGEHNVLNTLESIKAKIRLPKKSKVLQDRTLELLSILLKEAFPTSIPYLQIPTVFIYDEDGKYIWDKEKCNDKRQWICNTAVHEVGSRRSFVPFKLH